MTIRKVERRGETRLVIDIVFRKKDGSKGRYRHDAEVPTMAAARAEERRMLANVALHGDVFEPKPKPPKVEEKAPTLSFKDMVDLFLKGKAITSLKPTTRITYQELLDTRLVPRFGDRPLDSIGYDDATAVDADLVTEGLSASRRRNAQIVLRSIFNEALASGKIAERPRLPPLPKVGKTILKTLTMADVDQLLATASRQARLALGLIAYAGLRPGEVRGLRWMDVDLTARSIIVRQATSKGETSTPKSGHEREIPIAEKLLELLREAGPRRPHDLVSVNKLGKAWGDMGLCQATRRAAKKAGIPGRWRAHDLRHAFVTGLFRGGAPAPAVQALAGHADISTTSRYAHMGGNDLRAAIGLLGGRGNSVVTAPPT